MSDRYVDAVASALAHDDPGSIVVALGGGADSATLLAATVASAQDVPVRGVFVDHGLAASSVLCDSARSLGAHLDVPITVVAAPVDDGPDLEARARAVRYDAMEGVLGGTDVGLTAHTRDDQAETVLMRLASGSGSTGLAGIPGVRGRWVRPFLDCSKAELRDEADRLGLPYTDDPSNSDERFLRSRIRAKVVPVLESSIGNFVTTGMARSAGLLARDDATLSDIAGRIDVRLDDGGALIPAAALLTEERPIAARACRRALRHVDGGHPGTSADVDAILDTAANGVTHSLSGGLLSTDEGAHIRIGRPRRPEDPVHVELGDTVRWCGLLYRLRPDDSTPVIRGGRFTELAMAPVRRGVTIRGARDGDRLDIGVGTTPVTELLRVHGVARSLRPVSPVAVIDGKIAAVVGVRTATWAAPRSGDERAVIEREVGT